MKEIFFPQYHQLPNKEELRGRVYCKYHISWNHNTNSYWSFRNVIQYRVNMRILKFLREKEAMVKFLEEKEVMMKFLRKKDVMVKFPR